MSRATIVRAPGENKASMSLVQLGDDGTQHVLHVLQDGEAYHWHPQNDGVIITHPERPPLWIRLVDGLVVTRELRPA